MDIRDINKYCRIKDTMYFYRDKFSIEKDDNILCILLNIRLKDKKWKIKNDILRDFLLESKIDIIRP